MKHETFKKRVLIRRHEGEDILVNTAYTDLLFERIIKAVKIYGDGNEKRKRDTKDDKNDNNRK